MNKEAQRIAIACASGWVFTPSRKKGERGYITSPDKKEWAMIWADGSHGGNIPDYLTDLNAMHEAEKVLYSDAKQSERYAEFLLDVLEIPGPFIGGARCAFLTNHATAAQRAEAFLKTLNLWKE